MMDTGSKPSLQWQLMKYVRNLIANLLVQQISENNPQYPMDGNVLEVITGIQFSEEGIVVNTNQSTYIIEVKRVGDE